MAFEFAEPIPAQKKEIKNAMLAKGNLSSTDDRALSCREKQKEKNCVINNFLGRKPKKLQLNFVLLKMRKFTSLHSCVCTCDCRIIINVA